MCVWGRRCYTSSFRPRYLLVDKFDNIQRSTRLIGKNVLDDLSVSCMVILSIINMTRSAKTVCREIFSFFFFVHQITL